jgi:multisubunit Na+/H+ antiporter MnhF subunit
MESVLLLVLYISLAVHVALLGVAIWRIWRGENVIDRLIGLELVSTLTLAVLVLVALISGESLYIDVALGLGALGFISTIALTKYATDERMY